MSVTEEAAQWMLREINNRGVLDHSGTVSHLAKMYGDRATFRDGKGSLYITNAVRRRFNELTNWRAAFCSKQWRLPVI